MPKAEKEFDLNYAMNRWKLNSKRNVGPTSDSIRMCNPKSLEEWTQYYYENVRPKERLEMLGGSLYKHISEDIPNEDRFHPNLIASITKSDCANYMNKVVIERVYNGYLKERGML